jgi:pilus assembly protein CpaF
VNVVINPIAIDGPVVTIRKATRSLQRVEDLVARGTLTKRMAYFLYMAIAARLSRGRPPQPIDPGPIQIA